MVALVCQPECWFYSYGEGMGWVHSEKSLWHEDSSKERPWVVSDTHHGGRSDLDRAWSTASASPRGSTFSLHSWNRDVQTSVSLYEDSGRACPRLWRHPCRPLQKLPRAHRAVLYRRGLPRASLTHPPNKQFHFSRCLKETETFIDL